MWQSYDIDFTAPKCENGKKVERARMTVRQNGVQDPRQRQGHRGQHAAGLGGDPCTPGPIMLQDHGNPVQFRNVWLVEGQVKVFAHMP